MRSCVGGWLAGRGRARRVRARALRLPAPLARAAVLRSLPSCSPPPCAAPLVWPAPAVSGNLQHNGLFEPGYTWAW